MKNKEDQLVDAITQKVVEADAPMVAGYNMFQMQVCVPKDWTDEQVIQFCEKENPSGTQNGWQIKTEFGNGDPVRNPCEDRCNCVHIVVEV